MSIGTAYYYPSVSSIKNRDDLFHRALGAHAIARKMFFLLRAAVESLKYRF